MPQSHRNAVQPLSQSAFDATIRRNSSNAKSVFAIWKYAPIYVYAAAELLADAAAEHSAGHAPLPTRLPALPAIGASDQSAEKPLVAAASRAHEQMSQNSHQIRRQSQHDVDMQQQPQQDQLVQLGKQLGQIYS
jgi:hypothetical protein